MLLSRTAIILALYPCEPNGCAQLLVGNGASAELGGKESLLNLFFVSTNGKL